MKGFEDLPDPEPHLSESFQTNSGTGSKGAEDPQETPTQSHISPSIQVYEEKIGQVLCGEDE